MPPDTPSPDHPTTDAGYPAAPTLHAAVGPRVRTSPFFDATVADGLRSVTTYNHMWLPMGYGDPKAEYRRLTTGVSMWDVAAQRHLEVRGRDADQLVQAATVVDARAIEPGGGRHAPMLDHDGILINDPVLLRFDDGTWRCSIADSDLGLWLSALAAERGLDCRVRELDTATLAVQGPAAWTVAAALGLPDLRGEPHFHHLEAVAADVPVRLCHSGWSAQGGFELFVDEPARALDLWERVRRAGRHVGIGPGAPNPAERIEHVLLSYGTDTGYDATPDEVGLAGVVDLERGGDFVGRAAVEEERRRGARRHLLGAVLAGDPVDTLPRPAPLSHRGRSAGELRAATWSPRFAANIGLVLAPADLDPGVVADLLVPGRRRSLRLVSLPFDGDEIRAADHPEDG